MTHEPQEPQDSHEPHEIHATDLGRIVQQDAHALLASLQDASVDLLITSPPFPLITQKQYGNVGADEYLGWWRPFAEQIGRVLKPEGSFVLELGTVWDRGQPTRSTYQYEMVLMLTKEFGFCLAQDFYWWSPTRLPTPMEWTNVRRVRVKDAVSLVFWFGKTPWPKASNWRVLVPYSEAMETLLRQGGYTGHNTRRPSGYQMGVFTDRYRGAIPPNVLAIPHSESQDHYQRRCRQEGLRPHPARFPPDLPEFFVRFLTDPHDHVVDPFAGSCTVGAVCERLKRRWLCCDLQEDYLRGGLFRLEPQPPRKRPQNYTIHHPAALWEEDEQLSLFDHTTPLVEDGGRDHHKKKGEEEP